VQSCGVGFPQPLSIHYSSRGDSTSNTLSYLREHTRKLNTNRFVLSARKHARMPEEEKRNFVSLWYLPVSTKESSSVFKCWYNAVSRIYCLEFSCTSSLERTSLKTTCTKTHKMYVYFHVYCLVSSGTLRQKPVLCLYKQGIAYRPFCVSFVRKQIATNLTRLQRQKIAIISGNISFGIKVSNFDVEMYLQTPWRISRPWKSNGSPTRKKFSSISWNPKVHHRVHNSPLLVCVLNQMNSAHTLWYFYKIHFNIIIQFTYTSSKRSISYSFSFLCCSILSHSCHMLLSSHPLWCSQNKHIMRKNVNIKKRTKRTSRAITRHSHDIILTNTKCLKLFVFCI
jgi:hypothetical protein